MVTNEYMITVFRSNGFNCFPIPKETKIADFRYKASRTIPNQEILPEENYGIIPSADTGTAIVDFDNKARFRKFLHYMIDLGVMVIETPHGWHLPIIGISGIVTKTELFDYGIQTKKIIEIQGKDHYCVGVGSKVLDPDTNLIVEYFNRGTNKIYDVKGKDFNELIDDICKQCGVQPRVRDSRSSYKSFRDQFMKGEIPTKGTSNDYYHQAALVCNTEGLTEVETIERIRPIYDSWTQSKQFSGRTWNNILAKINDVYSHNQKLTEGGRGKKADGGMDRAGVAQTLFSERRFFSEIDLNELYENKNGFLERITHSLRRELILTYQAMTKEDYNDIIFKLVSMAPPIPETNRNLIVFKNGVYDHREKRLIETEEIADMGFKDFDYLEPSQDNFPTRFYKIMYENVPKDQYKRINAGLKAIFSNQLDPKISIIHGMSGVGKSTALAILNELLSDYSLTVELKQFLTDHFISAKIIGKHLLIFQDLPKEWKDFTILKTLTGEPKKTERGFMQDTITFENKVKIWATGNYLAIIPDEEKDAMYSRRLSLINNIRTEAYKEDPTLVKKIIEKEGEKIISWIVNLPNSECQYEDKQTLSKEWERIASPEIIYLEKYWQLSDEENDTSVMKIVNDCRDKTHINVSIEQMLKSLRRLGYVVRNNIIKNMAIKTIRNIPSPQLKTYDESEKA